MPETRTNTWKMDFWDNFRRSTLSLHMLVIILAKNKIVAILYILATPWCRFFKAYFWISKLLLSWMLYSTMDSIQTINRKILIIFFLLFLGKPISIWFDAFVVFFFSLFFFLFFFLHLVRSFGTSVLQWTRNKIYSSNVL